MIRLDAGVSLGNWRYVDDAEGTYRDSDGTDQAYSYALKDLKVGDMPKRSLSLESQHLLLMIQTIQLSYRFYDEFFSDWSPTSREYGEGDNPDRRDSWQIPHYSIVDLNASYDLPFESLEERNLSLF